MQNHYVMTDAWLKKLNYEIYSDEVILEKLMLLLYSWLMHTGYYLLVVMVITCEILNLSLVAFGHSW